MEPYSISQKYAIITILSQIMEADAIIHPKEIEYMNEIMRQMQLTPSDIDYMEDMSIEMAYRIIQLMSEKQKKDAISIFQKMMLVDGSIHPDEEVILKRFTMGN